MPLSRRRIDNLFRKAVEAPSQSFGIYAWCLARAMRMTGVFLLDGAVPSDLGWVVVCSPPAWLFSTGERPVMTAPAADPFALKTLMRGRSETVFENYLFRRVRTSVG